ncbi:MAG TPA: hypothetical protein VJQ55_13095, partial [Candidatus Binatia bacterium]|nr:hypothetical protein [Candidatus Binatia bacterium]
GIMAKKCCTSDKKSVCGREVMDTKVERFQQWGDGMVKKALSALRAHTGEKAWKKSATKTEVSLLEVQSHFYLEK